LVDLCVHLSGLPRLYYARVIGIDLISYQNDDALSRVVRVWSAAHPRLAAVWSRPAEAPGSLVRWPVFGSLDYIYVPVADVDGEALRYVQILGAELVWKVRGMGTTVACLRTGEHGPAILLSGHLQGPGAILVYRVQDYAATVAHLRARQIAVRELEIPHGPCATFTMQAGQRYAVYQLVRPDAVHLFDGRVDP
jgi:hypothetical protein